MGCHVVLPEHCLLPESFLKEKHIFIHAILADDATAGSTTVQIELLALFHEDVIVTYVLGSKHGTYMVHGHLSFHGNPNIVAIYIYNP